MSKKDTEFEDGTITVTYREDDGEVDRRRLAGIMGAATTAAMVLLIVTFSLGMVGAALGVGIGGFVANFDNVKTSGNASIYPVLGEQAACESAPQLEANLGGTAEITSTDSSQPAVEFFKDLPLPSPISDGDQFARITIAGNNDTNDPIEASNLALRLTALEAGVLALGNATDYDIDQRASIAEFSSNGDTAETAYADNGTDVSDPSGYPIDSDARINDSSFTDKTEFGISAKGFAIEDGTAAAHQVTFDGINIQSVNLAVQILNESNGGQNAVVDPDTPSDGDCDSLVKHAALDHQPTNLGEDTNLTESNGGIQLNETTDVEVDSDNNPRSDNFTNSP